MQHVKLDSPASRECRVLLQQAERFSVVTPQAAMCWNHDGSMLASASAKGTVLRVHRLPQAAKAFTFRRGTYPAPIHSLAFSPASVQPPLLCAASGHGTVHLFRLEEPDRCCHHPTSCVT